MAAHPIVGSVATLAVADPATCDRAGITDLVATPDAVKSELAVALEAAVAAAVARTHRSSA